MCFHFRFNVFAFTEQWSRGLGLTGRGKGEKAEKGKREGGMMEGEREGGSEVRGVKERERGEGRGGGKRAAGPGNVRERRCEIERKLEGEMERGMDCRGWRVMGLVVGR